MRNIIRIGAGTDGRNRFVAIALGVALAAGPAAMMPAAALAAPATDAAAASTTNVVKMGSQKTVTRMTISTMFKIKPTRFPSTDLSFLKRCTPMQTSRIMNANPVSRKNQYQGFPAVAKARSIRDPFMTSYWECSQCL